jgi:hypothetical protein
MRSPKNLLPGFTFVAVAIIAYWLKEQGAPLSQHPDTALGILSLEFAWNEDLLNSVKTAWAGPLTTIAQNNIYIDFLFLIAYGAFLSLACASMGRKLGGVWGQWGQNLSKLALVAAVLDAAENSLMLLSLQQKTSHYTALITTLFATVKFLLAALCVLYILAAGFRLLTRPKTR